MVEMQNTRRDACATSRSGQAVDRKNRMNRILKLRRPKHPAKPAFRVSPGNLSLRSLCSLRLMENKFNHRERRAHKETRNHGFPFSGSKSETGATLVLLDGSTTRFIAPAPPGRIRSEERRVGKE